MTLTDPQMESETDSSIQTLAVIDDVKTKMENVNHVLSEAEKYKKLLLNINNIFVEGNLLEVVFNFLNFLEIIQKYLKNNFRRQSFFLNHAQKNSLFPTYFLADCQIH